LTKKRHFMIDTTLIPNEDIIMKKTLLALSLATSLISSSLFAVELIGQTKSKSPLNVVSEISGMVEQANIELGEKIVKNTTLATIKNQDFKLEVSKQKANLSLAQADLKLKKSLFIRYQELKKKNSLSQNELDIASADYDSAKATVSLAKIELDKAQLDLQSTIIASAIDGYVVNRSIEDGAWVNQGDLLYQVINIDTLTIRLLASEFDIAELTVGQEMVVWPETNPNMKILSSIKRIGVEIDPQTFAYPIDVEIQNADHKLKPGMSIHASTILSNPQ